MAKPIHLRKLKAEMAMKELRVSDVARRARMHVSQVSELLNGKRVCPRRLSKLAEIIRSSRSPEHEAA